MANFTWLNAEIIQYVREAEFFLSIILSLNENLRFLFKNRANMQ